MGNDVEVEITGGVLSPPTLGVDAAGAVKLRAIGAADVSSVGRSKLTCFASDFSCELLLNLAMA